MLCIVCGEREEFEKGVCRKCIEERINVSVKGTLELTECPKCGSLRIGKKWHPDRQNQFLSRKVVQMVEVSEPGFEKICMEDGVNVSHDGTSTLASVTIKSDTLGEHEYRLSIPTRRIRNSCPTCNKVTGSYYEAILQIRTLNAEHTSTVDRVKDEAVSIMRGLNKKDAESFISSVRKVPEGLDIYLGKRTDGTRLAKHIMDNHLSTMKISKTLAGVRDGEKFYRFTFGVRLASLEEGSVVSVNGKRLLVLNTHPMGLDALDLSSERKTRVSKSDFFASDVRIVERTPQKKRFIVLSRENGEMQLMDGDSFSIITMRGNVEDEEVELFSFDGKYYLPGVA